MNNRIAELEAEVKRLNAMVTYDCRNPGVCPEVEDLKAENARLRASVEWALGEGDSDFSVPENAERFWWRKELRARAFPPAEPEYEEVEVKRWECPSCCSIYTEEKFRDHSVCGFKGEMIELTGTRRVKKVQKVKVKVELPVESETVSSVILLRGQIPFDVTCTYFAEYER